MAYANVCDRCQRDDHCQGASDRPLTPEAILAGELGAYKCICSVCKNIAHFTCPYCLLTSWNVSDIANRYCGHCHRFVETITDITKKLGPL